MSNLKFNKDAVWSNTGLKIMADQGILSVEDLNPEVQIRNRVSRWELFKIGLWLVRRALSRRAREGGNADG